MREYIGLLIDGGEVCTVVGLENFSSHFLRCCSEAIFWKAKARKVPPLWPPYPLHLILCHFPHMRAPPIPLVSSGG